MKPGDIKLYRENGGTAAAARMFGQHVTFRIAHCQHHSPDGFEWGYAGSGPADLALSILMQYTDDNTAMKLHQLFKHKFITPMPHEGGIITAEQIDAFLARESLKED